MSSPITTPSSSLKEPLHWFLYLKISLRFFKNTFYQTNVHPLDTTPLHCPLRLIFLLSLFIYKLSFQSFLFLTVYVSKYLASMMSGLVSPQPGVLKSHPHNTLYFSALSISRSLGSWVQKLNQIGI